MLRKLSQVEALQVSGGSIVVSPVDTVDHNVVTPGDGRSCISQEDFGAIVSGAPNKDDAFVIQQDPNGDPRYIEFNDTVIVYPGMTCATP